MVQADVGPVAEEAGPVHGADAPGLGALVRLNQMADAAVVADPVLARSLHRHVHLAVVACKPGRAVADLRLVHEHAGSAVLAFARRLSAAAGHLTPVPARARPALAAAAAGPTTEEGGRAAVEAEVVAGELLAGGARELEGAVADGVAAVGVEGAGAAVAAGGAGRVLARLAVVPGRAPAHGLPEGVFDAHPTVLAQPRTALALFAPLAREPLRTPALEPLVSAPDQGALAAVLAGAAGRRHLAARAGKILWADAPQLGRRRAALQALLHGGLVPVREAHAAVEAVASARVLVAELAGEHGVVAHAAGIVAVGVLFAPSPMAIQLRAVARPRLRANLLAHPIDLSEPFATFAAESGDSAPQTEGLLGTRIPAAGIRNPFILDALLHDGNVVDAADFLDDLGEKMCSVNNLNQGMARG